MQCPNQQKTSWIKRQWKLPWSQQRNHKASKALEISAARPMARVPSSNPKDSWSLPLWGAPLPCNFCLDPKRLRYTSWFVRVAPRVEVDYCNNFIYAIGHVAECVTGLQKQSKADDDQIYWSSMDAVHQKGWNEIIHQSQFAHCFLPLKLNPSFQTSSLLSKSCVTTLKVAIGCLPKNLQKYRFCALEIYAFIDAVCSMHKLDKWLKKTSASRLLTATKKSANVKSTHGAGTSRATSTGTICPWQSMAGPTIAKTHRCFFPSTALWSRWPGQNESATATWWKITACTCPSNWGESHCASEPWKT